MKRKGIILLSILLVVSMFMAACGTTTGGGGGTKDVAIGPNGSATQSAAKLILEAYGLEDGDYNSLAEGFGPASDLLQDGNIDLSFGLLGLPASSVVDLHTQTGDVHLVSLSDDALDYIEANSSYTRFTIPADSYDFLEEDVQTVTAHAILVANTDTISDELAYELARIMLEHQSENTHSQASFMTLENALNGLDGLPIHPGAKRYYEEQGLTVTAEVAEVTATDTPASIEMGTGGTGGTYYPLGGEMAGVWNNHIDGLNVRYTATGASVENLSLISRGELDLGMTVHVPALQALAGEADFDGNPVSNFAFIGHIYPEVMQIVTRTSTGINTIEDLKK